MGSKASRSTGTCTFPGCDVLDGWGKGVGDVNIDVGDGFSSRLNHMRAAPNSSWPDQDRITIGHVYLPISSSFTSLPNPPIHSQARPQPTANRGHHKLLHDWTTCHQPHKTRADITITTSSPRPSHFQASYLPTQPRAEVISDSRESKTQCERPVEYSSTSNINSLQGTWPCSRRHPILN